VKASDAGENQPRNMPKSRSCITYNYHQSHISTRFGDVTAVDSLTFHVAKGEVFGLLGPNGAGKTTTMRIILDVFRPD
jgi:ABC-type multidrug transport system ATPase subunit